MAVRGPERGASSEPPKHTEFMDIALEIQKLEKSCIRKNAAPLHAVLGIDFAFRPGGCFERLGSEWRAQFDVHEMHCRARRKKTGRLTA